MSNFEHSLRAAASWSKTDRFWLAWPQNTGARDRDQIARDDSVALAQLLSAHAPVTMVTACADLVQCSLQMPAGVMTLPTTSSQSLLAQQPVWLAGLSGQVLAGIAADCPGGLDLARAAGVDVVELPAGWRGDLIESDGEGTALVAARLADTLAGGRDEAERLMREKLGILQVIWLEDPGIDRVPARYLAPGVVAVPGGHGVSHPSYAALSANRDRLRMTSDRVGRNLTVLDLPCPSRQTGCYSDCMVAGNLVVVPEFEEGADSQAFAQVVAALPDSRVVAFPATHLAAPGNGLGRTVLAQPKMN
ncbi:MAG: agmatine deiminase family protein [Magnetospirillum gryphiswaldense]|nr:agmatine deiminase family protein [Magnetospirillum gryphiswaldense]